MIKVVAFDLVGTLYDPTSIPKEVLESYINQLQVKEEKALGLLPEAWNKIRQYDDDDRYLLEDVRDYARIVTFSNVPIENQLEMRSKRSRYVWWDHMIDLAIHTTRKPFHDAYGVLRHSFPHVQPSEILVVTGNRTFGDIEGAAQFGMRSMLIRNREQEDGTYVRDNTVGVMEVVKLLRDENA